MLMSSLSTLEDVELRSSLTAADNKNYQCHICKTAYLNRPNGAELTRQRRDAMGCFGVKKDFLHQVDGRIKFKTCVGNFVRPYVYLLLDLFRNYDRGVLPYPGGMMKQPGKLMEVFRVIDEWKQAKIEAREKALKAKTRSRGGR